MFVVVVGKGGRGLSTSTQFPSRRLQSDWRTPQRAPTSLTVADRTQSEPATVLASQIRNENFVSFKNGQVATRVERGESWEIDWPLHLTLEDTVNICDTVSFDLHSAATVSRQDFMGNPRRFLKFLCPCPTVGSHLFEKRFLSFIVINLKLKYFGLFLGRLNLRVAWLWRCRWLTAVLIVH